MPRSTGLRERKKREQRQRIADTAAALFAQRGYDAVSINDVAAAADVSYQTVYNYFPTKQDLGLDRAEELRAEYERRVRERSAGTSPARSLQPLVLADIERFRQCDPTIARGEHPALCVNSTTFRGFALLARERDAMAVAAAIVDTCPTVPALVAHAHGSALIAVVQSVTDRIGRGVAAAGVSDSAAYDLQHDAVEALDDLDRQFSLAVHGEFCSA